MRDRGCSFHVSAISAARVCPSPAGFFVQEMLQEFPAVKLWVDEENTAAISLYQSLNFQAIGTC
ncbi:MAG: hypothetical protein KME18_27895 [Phormidium tanganyikae FI6-MK23]|nr:hypothetical protein [Phormidium tanganyikae FI6-MK23]